MENTSEIHQIAAIVPTIPVATKKVHHFRKWQEMYRVRLRIRYEKFYMDNPDTGSFEQFCIDVFLHARPDVTEPTLN